MGLITNLIEQKVEAKHRDEEDRKQKLRQFYYDRIHDDNTPADVREQLSQDYFKLLSPEAKKSAQNGMGLIGKLKKAFGGGGPQQQQPSPSGTLTAPAQQPQQQNGLPTTPEQAQAAGKALQEGKEVPNNNPQASNAPKPSPNGKLAGPPAPAPQQQSNGKSLTAPTSQLPAHLFRTDAEQLEQAKKTDQQKAEGKLALEQSEYDAWLKRGKDLGLKERDLAEYAGSKGTKLPPQSKRIVEKQIGRPGIDPSTNKPYEDLWDHAVDPDGSETWAKHEQPPSKSMGQIRSVPHAISVNDAKATAKSGSIYKDQAGNDIALEKLPPNVGLQAMIAGDKMFWVPISPTQKTVTVGNEVYGVTPWEVKDIGAGGGTALGQARTGSSSTPTQVVMDAQGAPHVLGSTTTPVTTGARPNGSSATPRGGASPPGGATTPKPTGAPSGGGPSPRGMPGITPAMYNQALQRVTPVREAATQLFGDPAQPDMKGLVSYAHLADNKESRERLGKALRQTFTALNDATGGAHISAGAGPLSLSTGGFGAMLENAFNVPQKVAEQQARIMQETIGSLTPEEKEAYDATMGAFGTIVGLRSLTRASAAQASVATIEREMPIIGVNTANKEQFLDQSQRLAEIVYNGTKGIPEGMWDKAMLERLKTLPKELQKMKGSPSPKGKLDGPQKTVHFTEGQKAWDIPADKADAFKKAHPNAKAF